MHTMRYDKEKTQWEVGYFEPADDGGEDWHRLEFFDHQRDAERYVNYLNGGEGKAFAWAGIKGQQT